MDIKDNYRGSLSFKWFIENEQKIDLCPENYQRCFVWSKDKQQELLRTIFDSKPGLVPEIHVRNYNRPISNSSKIGIIAELMDGQQRLTTMFNFLKNDIKTPRKLEFEQVDGVFVDISDKFINELPKEAYDFYINYSLQVAFYTDINDSEAADIFKNKLNSGKPLTNTEKRNAHHTEVARFVRNISRLGNGKIPKHELFETKKGDKYSIAFKNFEETEFKYQDYDADELVASICYMVYKGYLNVCNNSELDRMYVNKDFEERFPHDKRVRLCLDVLKNCVLSSTGRTYKKMWNLSQLKYLMRIWLHLDLTLGYKIDNYDIFVRMYFTSCSKLYEPNETEKSQNKKISYFKECVIRQKASQGVEYSIKALSDIILLSPSSWGISLKNTAIREFSKDVIFAKHLEQNGICPMCHEKIDIEDAEGGHIIPYCDGGETNPDNLVVLHGRCNRKLGAKVFKKEDYENDKS